jgi:hypothetical protein
MSIALYKFIADFPVGPELSAEFPSGFAAHDALLLLRQSKPQRDDAAARAACRKSHGLALIHLVDFSMLNIEALSKSNDVAFIARCQEALREGSAVIYYPASRPVRPPDPVVKAEFRPA